MKTCGQKVEFSFSSMELQLLARHSCGMSQRGDEIYSTVKRQTEELLGVKTVPDLCFQRGKTYTALLEGWLEMGMRKSLP